MIYWLYAYEDDYGGEMLILFTSWGGGGGQKDVTVLFT